MARIHLSNAEARHLALAAQGFGSHRSHTPNDVLQHLHVLQIDSVNVFARSHYMPAFSRIGSYDTAQFDEQLWRGGQFTEYWAHEAAFLPISERHLFAWRMQDFRDRHARTGRTEALATTIDRVRKQLSTEGPSLVSELEQQRRANRGPWWDWSDTKRAVELLFAWGEVVSVGRERFMRRYALAEDVLEEQLLAETPRAEAQRSLIETASKALGVATLHDLADYHRLSLTEARATVRSLEEAGVLTPVSVDGWVTASGSPLPAWMHRDTTVPGRVAPDALLSPFDPVCWFRPRAERLYDFHYRIEIYTPKEKRRYGYYCLPLMVGGKLAGRIDLKADRARERLLVQAAWQEPGAPKRTAETAMKLLGRAASWQGLTEIETSGVGNLPLPTQRSVTQ